MYYDISSNRSIALVIFAHDEEAIIHQTVQQARNAMAAGDALFVIADNCQDGTAQIARSAGAQVFTRESGKPFGKGAALGWFVKYQWDIVRTFHMLVVLDADTQIEPGFTDRIREQMGEDDLVLQCFVRPVGFEISPISTLIALSELIEQSVFDKVRAFLGWPVRLRGTGMVISPRVLYAVADELQTEVEDIALTLLLVEKRIKVKRLDTVSVQDPKPTEAGAASRQRARWFRGQWAALWLYRNQVMKIASRGPGGISLISSLFLKPRWLTTAVKFALFFISLGNPFWAILFGSMLAYDLSLISFGLFKCKDRRHFIKAIIYLPVFVLMWMRSILLSFRGLTWLRVRENPAPAVIVDFKHPEMGKSGKAAETP
jgi:cellulose synthase/poly-beta-1,6-N-acetylglucosamine synthase-like glycosyltransferase